MLRRDLLKGLAGLLLSGKILAKSEPNSNTYTIPNCEPPKGIIYGNSIAIKNEYRMEVSDDNINPGDRLYYDLKDGGRITKNNTGHPIGTVMSKKDEYNCCQVAIYL